MSNKLFIIMKYTFKELLKSKILYITLLVGLATVLMTFVATEFTYGVPEKVAVDFGLGMLSLSSLGISLFMGANLLRSEIDSRTVYMVISRPVSRTTFISGKLLGLLTVLALNIVLLSLMILGVTKFLGGETSSVIFITIGFNFLESLLIMLVVVFFSLFSNTILSTVISICILLLGHAVKETQGTLFVKSNPVLKAVLEFYHLVLPAFYKLNFKDFAVYQKAIPGTYVLQAFGYSMFYSAFLFFMIVFIFNRKNLD